MPRHIADYDNAKVHRPVGARFAKGSAHFGPSSRSPSVSVQQATAEAIAAFFREFSIHPKWQYVVVEAVITTTDVHATVWDLTPDDKPIFQRRREALLWNTEHGRA